MLTKRILVAEDDSTTRRWIVEILGAEKFAVTAVADGRAALQKLRTSKFDLVVLDVWMPKMNGLDVLAAMRGKKGPKVIVITSDDTPGTLLAAVREQAHNYLAKPVERQTLLTLVCESLGQKSKGPPIGGISARPEWVELLVPC